MLFADRLYEAFLRGRREGKLNFSDFVIGLNSMQRADQDERSKCTHPYALRQAPATMLLCSLRFAAKIRVKTNAKYSLFQAVRLIKLGRNHACRTARNDRKHRRLCINDSRHDGKRTRCTQFCSSTVRLLLHRSPLCFDSRLSENCNCLCQCLDVFYVTAL